MEPPFKWKVGSAELISLQDSWMKAPASVLVGSTREDWDRYRDYCGRLMAGEELHVPAPEALPEPQHQASSKEAALTELRKIKQELAKPRKPGTDPN